VSGAESYHSHKLFCFLPTSHCLDSGTELYDFRNRQLQKRVGEVSHALDTLQHFHDGNVRLVQVRISGARLFLSQDHYSLPRAGGGVFTAI
jgi:hypothetical protein